MNQDREARRAEFDRKQREIFERKNEKKKEPEPPELNFRQADQDRRDAAAKAARATDREIQERARTEAGRRPIRIESTWDPTEERKTYRGYLITPANQKMQYWIVQRPTGQPIARFATKDPYGMINTMIDKENEAQDRRHNPPATRRDRQRLDVQRMRGEEPTEN